MLQLLLAVLAIIIRSLVFTYAVLSSAYVE